MQDEKNGLCYNGVFNFEDGKTKLTMIMDAKAYKLVPKIMNPILRGMIQRVIERDLDAVKAYCEV